jgi:hypothetical protein
MPDHSEVNFCIMGAPEDVQEVKAALSDEYGQFNPYRAYAMDEVISQIPTYLSPEKGESSLDYKKRMEKEFIELQKMESYERVFRLHYGPPMNPADFPGVDFIDKEICYFTSTWHPPIQEFISISNVFKRVAFAMKFDSSWLTHAGCVYISRGAVWYANHRMHFKDRDGFDITLDQNFGFRYLTKFRKLGMIVSSEKLQGIERTFVRADPDDMKYQLPYFPHWDFDNDHDPDDEFIPDDYVPVLYEPSKSELREYWDEEIAEILQLERKISYYQKITDNE